MTRPVDEIKKKRETVWVIGQDGKIKRKRKRIQQSGIVRKACQAM